MAKIDVNKVELVWPGKYNEDGTLREVPRENLPFQVIERVNESRATREAKKLPSQISLFDVWEGKEGDSFEEGWRNKLIWGDNSLVMGSLLKHFAGKIDLIYIDPPFATGADFSFSTQLGDEEVTKEQSIIEEKAYRDSWGSGSVSYLQMIISRLQIMRDLLSDEGSIYVHCDWRLNSSIRLILDEIFGQDRHVNEIAWCYKSGGATNKRYARKHDTILYYSKAENPIFNVQKEKSYNRGFKPYNFKGVEEFQDEIGWYTLVNMKDYWNIDMVGRTSGERLNYPTQKPEKLLEPIILSSSNPGSLIADFFCGSGTTLAVSEKLGRRWIGCDLSRFAIHTSRKRLLEIEDCKSFEILNLGKYERQYWQGMTFTEKGDVNLQAIYDYLAFILRLYGAQPLSGTYHLHGKKGKALIHIGEVDSPITIDEVSTALEECIQLNQNELHILGWEWEMGLNDLMVNEAKNKGVKLLLLQIPREVMEQQAVDKGDIRFFELAYLDVDIKTKGLTTQIQLKDFVIPNTELIPEDVREKISKWSDYIDYWAVDWDFQEDTFIHGWVAYRTNQERNLPLVSDKYKYKEPGKYTVVVKVIDVFGNDTTQAFEVEVKS